MIFIISYLYKKSTLPTTHKSRTFLSLFNTSLTYEALKSGKAFLIIKDKLELLEKSSVKLNIVRFFIRLMKESKALDMKKYTVLQAILLPIKGL